MTSSDRMFTICLSDGNFSYPFGVTTEIKDKLSPFCLIVLKKLYKYPVDDPIKPGVVLSIFWVTEMEVVMDDYAGIIGIPVDIRKHLFDYETEYPLLNHWDISWWDPDYDHDVENNSDEVVE